MPILYFLSCWLLSLPIFGQNIPKISGWYSGYTKIYNMKHKYFERYAVQMKIYQNNSVIAASVMDRVLGTKNFAITEMWGTIREDLLYLKAVQFKRKENDEFYDFILTDYILSLSKLSENMLFGVLSSFYKNRNNIITHPYDSVFLERKSTAMTLEDLYKYSLPKFDDQPERAAKMKQHRQELNKIDDIFYHKKPPPASKRTKKNNSITSHKKDKK